MIFFAILLISCILRIAFFVERANAFALLSAFVLAFVAYIFLVVKKETTSNIPFWKIGLGIGIGLRIVLLFALPNLSDDFYRFIWDGRLLNHGINPFLELPSFYYQNNLHSDFLTPDLYAALNSPNYYTVYPPVLQLIFGCATFIFPSSVVGSVIVMKLFLLFAELGTLFLLVRLLQHFQLPQKNVLLYALNPVALLEIMGNLHFEGIMIFFVLLSIWALIRQKWLFSALAISVAIAAKLLPLMFLPFLIYRLQWKSLSYFFVVGVSVLLLFSPLLNAVFIQHLSESIHLYFSHFEYNGGIYYALRWLGYQLAGFNMIQYISPWLSLTVFAAVVYTAVRTKERDFYQLPQNMLFALTAFYLLATTVHPWYITSMIALSALTRFRYPVAWSGLIFLTYINYSYEPFHENLMLVAVEYLVLFGLMVWEGTKKPSFF